MGYDLHMLKKPRKLPAGWKPQYEGQANYYRLNISGMSVMRGVMWNAGLLVEGQLELPEWPPGWMTEDRAMELHEHLEEGEKLEKKATKKEKAAYQSHRKKLEKALAARLSKKHVPLCKFTSNDGWHVVPEECQLIADTLLRILDADPDELWEPVDLEWTGKAEELYEWVKHWAVWNALAARHGGYSVG